MMSTIDQPTTHELKDAARPIASLISKSEKAQQKLMPGSWQHTMLQKNLDALRIASSLLNQSTASRFSLGRADLQGAIAACASMMQRTEKAHGGFSPGTSQHTLTRNRLNALRVATLLLKTELEACDD